MGRKTLFQLFSPTLAGKMKKQNLMALETSI
jgi:hypothetical protein